MWDPFCTITWLGTILHFCTDMVHSVVKYLSETWRIPQCSYISLVPDYFSLGFMTKMWLIFQLSIQFTVGICEVCDWMTNHTWPYIFVLPSNSTIPFLMSSVYLLLIKHQAYSNLVSLDTAPFANSLLYFFSNFCQKQHQQLSNTIYLSLPQSKRFTAKHMLIYSLCYITFIIKYAEITSLALAHSSP